LFENADGVQVSRFGLIRTRRMEDATDRIFGSRPFSSHPARAGHALNKLTPLPTQKIFLN